MSAWPSATPTTLPVLPTVAMDVLDERHVATFVTFRVVPSDIVATAEKNDVMPTGGALPVTVTMVTVAEEEPPTVMCSLPVTFW